MSGVAVVRFLLSQNSAVLAVVPAAKIMAGILPLGIAMPAIGVSQVGDVVRTTLGMNSPKTLITERVQVTWHVANYGVQKSLGQLILKACPNTRGTVNGVEVESVLPDSASGDLSDIDPGRLIQARDFRVLWKVTN